MALLFAIFFCLMKKINHWSSAFFLPFNDSDFNSKKNDCATHENVLCRQIINVYNPA